MEPAVLPNIIQLFTGASWVDDFDFFVDTLANPDSLSNQRADLTLDPVPGSVGLTPLVLSTSTGNGWLSWASDNLLAVRVPRDRIKQMKPGLYNFGLRLTPPEGTTDDLVLIGKAQVNKGVPA